MATMYTWDPITGTYIQSDTGTYILDDTGAYIPSANQTFSVSTDLPDYAPGSTATFTANVGVGDTVTFDVTDVAGTAVSGTDQPWTITDGGLGDLDGVANGVIQSSWAVGPDAAGEAFVLTATDISTGAIATTAFTDSPPPEPTTFAYVDPHVDLAATANVTTPTGDLILANGGSALVTLATSGTGNFGTFVEVQSSPTEDGYNTTNNTVLDGKNSDQFNTAIKLSDLQAVHANGSAATVLGSDTYYEFKLDLHQANSKPYISLDALQFWQSGTANLGPGTFVSGTNPDGSPSFSFNAVQATLAYDFGEKSILLNSLFTAGSGGGTDLVVLVKTDDFSSLKGDYVYLYSAFGYQGGDWSANSTFEEWGALLKSGVTPPPPTPHAALSVDKETFCGDSPTDSHSISNGIVLAGSEISWTYTVTATTDAVSNLVLTDDNGTPNNPLDDFHPTFVFGVAGGPGADATHNIGDINNNDILDLGETWRFVQTGIAAVGSYSNEAFADGTSVQDGTAAGEGFDTSGYFGADPHIHITKVTNGQANPALTAGQAITWTYTVTNTGNVALANIVITDDNGTVLPTGDDFHPTLVSGDVNNNGLLDLNETWIFTATGTAEKLTYTNHVTVAGTTDIDGVVVATDACSDSLSASGSASSGYTGAQTLAGLTKGFWATHLTLWDVVADEKGAGSEINAAPGYDWNHNGTIAATTIGNLTTSGSSSSLGLVKTASNGGGDSGLLMGDLNHDGLVAGDGSSDHLFFDLASAQILANSSVSGDARIILASQAVAAQLNEYNDYVYDQAHGSGLAAGFDASPTGLIEEAVLWLKGLGPLSNGDSKVNWSTANDLTSPTAVQAIIDLGNNSSNPLVGTNDYTISGGAITFKSTSMPSSDASWNHFATVFTGYTPGTDSLGNAINNPGNFNTVQADGEGLKNALAAYNHGGTGTAGFVVSADGSQVGWQDSLGGAVYDIHANTADAFWGILEDQNLLGHTIVGVTGVHV